MGQEIDEEIFDEDDRATFYQRLVRETNSLKQAFSNGKFKDSFPTAGFELEGILLDNKNRPFGKNLEFLAALNNPLATTELANFNIEYNGRPREFRARALSEFEAEMGAFIISANQTAGMMGAKPIFIGTAPNLLPDDFCIENITDSKRYRAMNREILRARHGHALSVKLQGHDEIHLKQTNVMLEAATTSFQIHFKVPHLSAHHFYNAAIAAAGPVLAVCGNSPFLFGNSLWRETRIPLFEQAVNIGNKKTPRVSMGSGYLKNSLFECYEENLKNHDSLLPMLLKEKPDRYAHINLHNGVIWRWIRPIIGFNQDGSLHTRIESRFLPSGPSARDMAANMAFFLGLVFHFGSQLRLGARNPVEFDDAKYNFYTAARFGLNCDLVWNNSSARATELVERLIASSRFGLEQLQIDGEEREHYLTTIRERARSGQTGAIWQERKFAVTGGDLNALVDDYHGLQNTQMAVHDWPIII